MSNRCLKNCDSRVSQAALRVGSRAAPLVEVLVVEPTEIHEAESVAREDDHRLHLLVAASGGRAAGHDPI